MIVYLAGPMDDVTKNEREGWRNHSKAKLSDEGIITFDPCGAFITSKHWTSNRSEARRIMMVNQMAIEMSNMVLCNLSGEGRAFGSIREIEYARNRGVDVVLITPKGGLASYYASDIDKQFDSLDNALDHILAKHTGRV